MNLAAVNLDPVCLNMQVNPLAGCLPTLATIPVFIGLYRCVLSGDCRTLLAGWQAGWTCGCVMSLCLWRGCLFVECLPQAAYPAIACGSPMPNVQLLDALRCSAATVGTQLSLRG